MQKNIIKLFLSCLLISGCSSTPTNNIKSLDSPVETPEALAISLLDNMNLQVVLDQTIEQVLQVQLKNKPQLVPYKDVMLEFLTKHMNYKSIKPDLVNIYASEFTAAELKELNAFYSTPTGKKIIEKTPELTARGAEIGSQKIKDNLPELRQMIKAETLRIQKNKSN